MSHDDDELKSPEQLMREVDATEARWAREARGKERRKSARWKEVAAWVVLALVTFGGWFAYRLVAVHFGWYAGASIVGICPLVGVVAAIAALRALFRAVIGTALD
jgi:hypothetical protein